MSTTSSPVRRFFAWRWWRGWRGWVVFAVVAALACTAGGLALARVFAPAPDPWSRFPGVPQVSTDQILANQTIEELEPRVEAAMADLRATLTEEFGFAWVAKGEPRVERESNRYRGTSLLNTYDSVSWQTTTTLRSEPEKHRLVEVASRVMAEYGFGSPALLNTTGPDALEAFGGFTLADQGRWVLAGHPPEVSRGDLLVTILDLEQDRTGVLAAQSEEDAASLGWEREYVSVAYHGEFMLSEADRAEFERRAERYKGHIAPVPGRNKD